MRALIVLAAAAALPGSLRAAEEPAKPRGLQATLQADVKAEGLGEAYAKILGDFLAAKIKVAGGKLSAEEIIDHLIQGQQDFATPLQEKKFSGVEIDLAPGTYSRSELMGKIAAAERGEFRINKEGRIVFRQAPAKEAK